MYIVDLNISLCFESASPCALDVEVFKQTVLKKRECPKYTGFLQSGKCQREILDSNSKYGWHRASHCKWNIILMLPIWNLTCGFLSGFSLTVWKQENEVNGTTLTTAEIVVLQEDLGLSRYFLDSACSRSTALYNPHIDYWRNGNYRAKLICVLCYRFSLSCWMVLRR